jgi:membrane fusion protein
MSSSLFRSEVIESRATRLHGDVLLGSSVPAWVTTGFVVIAVGGALIWAALASYARTESVAGVVSSVQPLAKVVAARPGLVTSVFVSEGDVVAAGARLLTVRIEQQTEAGGTTATASLAAIDAQRRLAEQRLALEPARAAAERARLNAVIAGARSQREEITAQLALQDAMVSSTRNAFDQIAPVVAKGFVSRNEFERRRQAWLQAEQGRRSLMQQRDAATANIATAAAELTRLPIDSAANISQLQAAMEQLAQGRAQQAGEQGYSVVAPIAGRVTSVQTAPGRFVDGRVPLLTIVPENAVMRVDLFAPSRSMGFVAPGQSVRLLYDPFPYQRFGSFGGRIESISRAVIAPNEVDAALQLKEPVYRVKVAIDDQRIKAYGVEAPLQPGMTLTANIVLERRSFLDWLLAPLRAVRSRS